MTQAIGRVCGKTEGGLRIISSSLHRHVGGLKQGAQRGPRAVVMLELIALGNCQMWRKQQTRMPFGQ